MKLNARQLERQEAKQAAMLATMAVAFWKQNQQEANRPETCYTCKQLLEQAEVYILNSQYRYEV